MKFGIRDFEKIIRDMAQFPVPVVCHVETSVYEPVPS
jgi:hypothetical protein